MKKLIFGVIIGISFTALISAGIAEFVVSKKTAEVEMYKGVYVFTDCKPVTEYEYMGTIEMKIAVTGKYNEVKNYVVKKSKDKYPNCDAVIFDGTGSADVIKFK